jgi:predicted phosphodiesterase
MTVRISDEDLIADLRRVIGEVGPRLTSRGYEAAGQYAVRTLVYRFGSWEAAMARALGVASEGGVARDVQPAAFRQHDDPLAHAKTDPPPAFTAPALPIDPADEATVDAMMARRRASTMRTPAAQRAAFVAGMDDGAKVKPTSVHEMRSQTVFIVSDIHIPHHDHAAWEAIVACMNDVRPDWVIVLGDGIDLGMLSAYKRGRNDPVEALPEVKAFTREMNRISHLTKRTTILYGNHCIRWENYLLGAKPEVMKGVRGLTLEDQCRWEGMHPSIEWTKESTFNTGIKLGSKCIARHGDKQARNGISQPRNLANNMLTKSNGFSEIVGHHHRLSYQVQTAHEVDAFAIANPCVTPMHDYAGSDRRWQQGFTCVELSAPDFDDVTAYPVLMQRQRFSFRGKTYDGHAIAREMGVAA